MQFFLISIGYFLFIISFNAIITLYHHDLFELTIGIVFIYLFVAPFALIFISISEFFKLRNISIYMIFGATLALLGIYNGNFKFDNQNTFSLLYNIFIISTGAVSGIVYWAVAGKRAGSWIEEPTIGFLKNLLNYFASLFFTALALLFPFILIYIVVTMR